MKSEWRSDKGQTHGDDAPAGRAVGGGVGNAVKVGSSVSRATDLGIWKWLEGIGRKSDSGLDALLEWARCAKSDSARQTDRQIDETVQLYNAIPLSWLHGFPTRSGVK